MDGWNDGRDGREKAGGWVMDGLAGFGCCGWFDWLDWGQTGD